IGTGSGGGTFKDLSVRASPGGARIWRIELYQPDTSNLDIVFFDNLSFTLTDTTAPTITATANKTQLWPPTGLAVPVVVTGKITDNAGGSGIDPTTVSYTVVDEYGQNQPAGAITLALDGSYSFTVDLVADRNGSDRDGRTYTITVSAKD